MEKQCAGCGKVFEDGTGQPGPISPRPYGCCDDCNKATFQHKVHDFEGGACKTCGTKEEDHKAFLASQANIPPTPSAPVISVPKRQRKVVASPKSS